MSLENMQCCKLSRNVGCSLGATKEVHGMQVSGEVQGTRWRPQMYSEACTARLRRARRLIRFETMGYLTWHGYVRDMEWGMTHINMSCNLLRYI